MDRKKAIGRVEKWCKLNQFDEAIRFIDGLNEDCDFLEEAIVFVAIDLYEKKLEYEKAYHLIKKGIALFPDSLTLHTTLCLNLNASGYKKDAWELSRSISDAFPLSPEAWILQAELSYDIGDFTTAIDALDNAFTCTAKINSSAINYHLFFLKGFYLYKKGSYISAIDCFLELKSFKEYNKAENDPLIAECYLRIGDYEKAFNFLNGLIGQKDIVDEISFYGNLIHCCLRTGRQSVAVDLLSEALNKYPKAIIEYLNTLRILEDYEKESAIGKEKILHADELIRDFYKKNTYYN